MPKENPYNPARPASAKILVGRQALKRQLTDGLQNGHCFGLVGGPGMGKSSLLLAVQKELIARQNSQQVGSLPLPLYIECKKWHKGVEDLLVVIVERLVEAFKTQRRLLAEPSEGILTKSHEAAKGRRLEAALTPLLDWAYEQEQYVHCPILLIDSLHRISDKNWFYQFASILQTSVNKQTIALVLAGKEALAGEFRDDASPLRLLITQHYTLPPLTRTETAALIEKASDHGWSVEEKDACAELAYNLTNGHPYRLHYYLYGVLSKEGKLTTAGLEAKHNEPHTLLYLQNILKASPNSPESSNDRPCFAERKELVEHLLAIPSIADPSRRPSVISQLRSEIKTNVVYNSVDKIYVMNIVKACLQYPNGMQELMDILQFFEGDSTPMQQLKKSIKIYFF